jgi:hypothetical protein
LVSGDIPEVIKVLCEIVILVASFLLGRKTKKK